MYRIKKRVKSDVETNIQNRMDNFVFTMDITNKTKYSYFSVFYNTYIPHEEEVVYAYVCLPSPALEQRTRL